MARVAVALGVVIALLLSAILVVLLTRAPDRRITIERDTSCELGAGYLAYERYQECLRDER